MSLGCGFRLSRMSEDPPWAVREKGLLVFLLGKEGGGHGRGRFEAIKLSAQGPNTGTARRVD